MIISMSLKKKKSKNSLVKNLIKKNQPTKSDLKESNEWVNREETGVNHELFQKYFKFQRLSDMLKAAYTTNDKNKNKKLVQLIKSGLSDLKNKIENMSKEEK